MDHIFSCLHTSLSREDVARLYGAQGWRVIKCGRKEFEVRCEWAEFVIEASSPILMHGPAQNAIENLERIVSPLNRSDVAYEVECYGDDGELLQRIVSGAIPEPNPESIAPHRPIAYP